MKKLIEITNCYDLEGNNNLLMNNNPFPIATERESYVINEGLNVYRLLFKRNKILAPNLNELQNICSLNDL